MLCGLPDTYEGIMALANLDEEKFKLLEIKGILLNKYDRRAAKEMNNLEERNQSSVSSNQRGVSSKQGGVSSKQGGISSTKGT